MASQWYCRINNTQFGPMSGAELKRLAREGRLTADSHVRKGLDSGWVAAKHVSGLIEGSAIRAAGVASADSSIKAAPPSRRRTPKSVGVKAAPARAAKPPAARVTSSPSTSDSVTIAGAETTAMPVAAVPVAVTPVANASPSTLSGQHTALTPTKKKSALPMILGIVALVVVVLGGTVAFGVWYAFNQATTAVANFSDQVNAEMAAIETEIDRADRDINGKATTADATNQVDSSKTSVAPAPVAAENPIDPREEIISRVKSWRPAMKADKTVKVQTSKMSFEVASVWLGDDLTGDITDPGNGAALGGEPAPKYVMVQMKIGNRQSQPWLYEGWNGAGDSTLRGQAILVDDQNRFGDLVPIEQAPDDSRLRPTKIEPSSTVADTLVFEIPSMDFNHLHLALPVRGVGSGYYGFRLDKAMILGSGEHADPSSGDDLGGPVKIPGLAGGSTDEPSTGTTVTQPPVEEQPVDEQPSRGRDPDGPGEAIAIPGLP